MASIFRNRSHGAGRFRLAICRTGRSCWWTWNDSVFCARCRGAYVFTQRYLPVPGGPAPDLSRLFDDRADALLDELVRIIFPQNMKSMETY
jgi:hypothetical protein